MLVLGIDPGTAATGYGLVSELPAASRASGTRFVAGLKLVECGVIRTSARAPLSVRLQEVFRGVQDVIARFEPDLVAVEDVFYARNVRTTLALGQARGVVLLAAAEAGLAVREYPPAEIKKAVVGTGQATKDQVQFMLTRLLQLRTAPRPADAADGVAAAVACLLTAHAPRLSDVENGAIHRRPTSLGGAAGALPRQAARRRR